MKNKIFIYSILVAIMTTFGVWSVFAAITHFTGRNVGYALTDGSFYNTGSGNAGVATMTGAWVDGNILSGQVTLQSIGINNTFRGFIVPPSGVNPTRTCWTLSGILETTNAWDITLTGSNTDIYYNPVTRQLEGYGYNRNLGKVWLGMDKYCADKIINDTELEIIKTNGMLPTEQSAFIGKVKILGNIGDNNSIFGEIYSAQRGVNMARYTQVLQEIRKNVVLLSRNISENHKNSTFTTATPLGNNIFYINNSPTLQTLNLSSISDNIRSIIVVGGDVVITNDLPDNSHPRAIVVIENSHNIGGNIYIKENVKKIHTSLVAEKSLLSGEWNGVIYNDTPEEIATPKKNQLYIKGTLFSRNTIGGASKDVNNPVCPYSSGTCLVQEAQKYDLNYFRLFDKNESEANDQRAISGHDDYSMIIEYDSRVVSNPPPALDFLR